MTEEEKRRRFGIGTTGAEESEKQAIGIRTPTAEQVGQGVRSFIPKAIDKANTFVRNTSPVREIYGAADMVGRFGRGFFGGGDKTGQEQKGSQPGAKPDLAAPPSQQPKRGEAQAATISGSPATPVSNPVQDIAARQKRTFSPQQQPQQAIAQQTEIMNGNQDMPFPKPPTGANNWGFAISPEAQVAQTDRYRAKIDAWGTKNGQVPLSQSQAELASAEAKLASAEAKEIPANSASDRRYQEAQITGQNMTGRQETSITPMQIAKMEADANQAYQNHFSNATGPINPTDYLDKEMTKPIDKKLWLYKNLGNTAYSLFGPPDERTQALSVINSDPSLWQQFIDANEQTRESLLQRIISGS